MFFAASCQVGKVEVDDCNVGFGVRRQYLFACIAGLAGIAVIAGIATTEQNSGASTGEQLRAVKPNAGVRSGDEDGLAGLVGNICCSEVGDHVVGSLVL